MTSWKRNVCWGRKQINHCQGLKIKEGTDNKRSQVNFLGQYNVLFLGYDNSSTMNCIFQYSLNCTTRVNFIYIQQEWILSSVNWTSVNLTIKKETLVSKRRFKTKIYQNNSVYWHYHLIKIRRSIYCILNFLWRTLNQIFK